MIVGVEWSVALPDGFAVRVQKDMLDLVHEYSDSSPETREIDAYQAGYKVAHEYPTSKVFSRKSQASGYNEFLVVGNADVTIDEYVELTYCECEETFRTQQTLFYAEDLLDARVLNVTLARCDDDPFRHFGVRYKKMNMAYNGVFAPRDTTYVECTGSFVNKKGLRGVYCVRESMDFDEIPEIPGVVRFYMKAMFLLTEARDGTVELLQVMTANPLGKLPAWMFNKTSMAYSHMSDDYAKYLQQKRLLAYVASKRKPRHPIKKAKACSSCAGAFRGLRARHECWGCRESMCGKCVVPIPRVFIGVDGSMKAVPDEFCKRCFLQARSYRTSSSASSFRLHASDDTTEHSHHSNQTRSSSGNESYAKDLTDEDDVPSAVPPQAAPAPAFDAMDMESHLSQMQLGIETQRYLVAQMRSRLEAQAV